MSGYAKYMYASEELEPGSGWDYSTVLSSFRENKIHNGAILGKIISDSYVKKGIESRYNGKNIPMVTFSVTDLLRFNSLYEAYEELNEAMIIKSIGDCSYFEKEASKVCDLLNDCVIYQRESAVFNDATGLSVYFPYSMGDYLSFKYYLKYINEICESNSIKSYYYYSTSGCVNDELKDYLQGFGIDNIPIVDSSGLDSIADTIILAFH